MGDILFVLRMTVYAVLVVMIMQVKVGSSTIEEKVIDFTHNSSIAVSVQKVAEGAVHMIGIGYNRAVQNVNSAFSKNHLKENIPGNRLQPTIESTKQILRETFGAEGDTIIDDGENSEAAE